jgi:hypothetical protein
VGMRTRLLGLAVAVFLTFGGTMAQASFSDGSPEAVTADVLLVRPFCLVATIVGSAVFVVSLPAAAISKSTDKAADALVKGPAKATFTRPVGDFSALK